MYFDCSKLTLSLLLYTVYAECGNHGVCNRVNGSCACDSGFKGDACLDNSDEQVKFVCSLASVVFLAAFGFSCKDWLF